CCLCKVNDSNFLRASHIKPWSKSNSIEKLDVNNGLLLCPNHDALFDIGFISFKDDGNILISEKLTDVNKLMLNINPNMKIEVTTSNLEYIRYHRENIYKR
ncbi:MAG: HNH endonuclease, partial [Lachnospiraceae bacterium]|nr:HNH endonuclease [Lachnospiraceae bacterium]